MVAQLLRLKLAIMANSFRRSPVQLLGLLISLGYCIAATIAISVGFHLLGSVGIGLATDVAVVAGSLITLGFMLVPLAFGADDTLDPRAFSLYGLSNTKLAGALFVVALLGLPSIAIASIAIAQVTTWSSNSVAAVVASIGATLIVVTCVLAARVSTSLAAFSLHSTRARVATRLAALAILASAAPLAVVVFFVDWNRDGQHILSAFAEFAAWTPLGAAWSAPAEAAAGHAGLAVVKIAISVGFVGVLWLVWRGLLEWMIRSPGRPDPARRSAGLGWFARMPHTPTGAVAARIVTYWLRDSRYHTSLYAIPVAPAIFVAALAVAGVPWNVLALIPVPAMCLFLSWLIHNDVATDNSAIWLHISSSVRGSSDRFGRIVPALMIGIPLIAAGAPVSAWLSGDPSVLPSLIGVSASALLGGLGISSMISARFPYPTTRPGDSPFAQPQASGTASGLIQSVAFFATLIITLPSIAFAIFGLISGGEWPIISLLVGIGVGVAVLVLGIFVGGWLFTRRSPELLAFTLRT